MATCELVDLNAPVGCNDKGGGVAAWVGRRSQIDLTATSADLTEATWTLSDLTMTSTNVFSFIDADQLTMKVDDVYTDETNVHTSTATLVITGMDAALNAALRGYEACCDLVLIFKQTNGQTLIYGLDWNATDELAQKPVNKPRFTNITRSTGEKAGKTNVTLTYVSQTNEAPITFTGTVPV